MESRSRHTHAAFDEVLAAARSGEGWAFERLYGSLAKQVTAFATMRGSRDPEAITNDAFLRAFRNLTTFAGDEAAFRSWVFSITRNLLIDSHRHELRRPPVAAEEQTDHANTGWRTVHRSAEVEAFEDMSIDRVVRMLDLLSDDQRDVIALRIVADLSVKEVAAIVAKPETAVKALQRRGLRRLQRETSSQVVS